MIETASGDTSFGKCSVTVKWQLEGEKGGLVGADYVNDILSMPKTFRVVRDKRACLFLSGTISFVICASNENCPD